MKNIYQNMLKKILEASKSLITLLSNWAYSLKNDFDFHNSHTELLAIWTVLFMTITGLFVVGLKSKLSIILLLLILSFVITLIVVSFTTYYLHAIKYQKRGQLLPKTHNLLNKCFKLRTLLRFVKLPNFKHLIKCDFKFSS